MFVVSYSYSLTTLPESMGWILLFWRLETDALDLSQKGTGLAHRSSAEEASQACTPEMLMKWLTKVGVRKQKEFHLTLYRSNRLFTQREQRFRWIPEGVPHKSRSQKGGFIVAPSLGVQSSTVGELWCKAGGCWCPPQVLLFIWPRKESKPMKLGSWPLRELFSSQGNLFENTHGHT